jgi:ATP-dependent Clp protease ATP-binding subunit ClpB
MNLNNFTIKAQEIVQQAQQLAFNAQSPAIETAHFLQALINDTEGPVVHLLKKNNVNVQFVEGKLNEQIKRYPQMQGGEPAQSLSREMNNALLRTANVLKTFGDDGKIEINGKRRCSKRPQRHRGNIPTSGKG